MSKHDTCNHFLQETFVSWTWKYQMKSNRVVASLHIVV